MRRRFPVESNAARMSDSSKVTESDLSGRGGSSAADHAGTDAKSGSKSSKQSGGGSAVNSSAKHQQDSGGSGQSDQKGGGSQSSNANDKGNNGSGSQSSNANVDGVLSQTLDENSNDWRNGSGNGLGSNAQGGNSVDHFEPSTSFAEEDDDGVRPGDLYGKFTWKIENFSEISKRELRSNVFEVGEYKWYILVYPQGCDVSNHLSLFLCVADYDKLLPGWSHFAQFTIAVVNKDPKKSKYSDTLHRFCKKEHDWGWKKFMELSKVLDGFTVSDTLVIKAQVQVIREKQNRPFRCLDTQYRRELVRVYLTNVEGICRRFLEERREKLAKLRECPESFHEFWDSLSLQLRSCLASDRADNILKLLVKRFFNEKEVTSTLVMDALHSGYKSLQVDQVPPGSVPASLTSDRKGAKGDKGGKGGASKDMAAAGAKTGAPSQAARAGAAANKSSTSSEPPVSISMEENLTYLTGDVMKTLEQAANEAVPPHNEDKDLDDYGKDSLERDERRLVELGKQAIEMFVLSHLYTNRIEVAFKENEALKRQEALIREEEEAERLESERQLKKQEAERERRNRRKEKKQRKKEKKEAEVAAAEAERKAAEEEKKKKDDEAKRLREEALEKERLQREQEREAARQAAKEKEAAKKAAKKAAMLKEEQARQKQQAEAEALQQQQAAAAAAKEKERLAAEEKEKKLQQQKSQSLEAQQSADKAVLIQEKDKVIADLSKKVEALEVQLTQKNGTIAKLQSQLKQTVEVIQHLKERSNEWQHAVPGSAPGTPEQQKLVPSDYPHRSSTSSGGSPGTAANDPSGVPLGQDPSQHGGMVSPIKAYAQTANPRVFSSIPKGYQGGAGAMGNGAHSGPQLSSMPGHLGAQVPNGMPAYLGAQQVGPGPQAPAIPGEKTAAAAAASGMVNGKAAADYGHMMMPPMANQGSYRLAPVGQPVANHGGLPQDNSGLDDFAHMGLITDLLE